MTANPDNNCCKEESLIFLLLLGKPSIFFHIIMTLFGGNEATNEWFSVYGTLYVPSLDTSMVYKLCIIYQLQTIGQHNLVMCIY